MKQLQSNKPRAFMLSFGGQYPYVKTNKHMPEQFRKSAESEFAHCEKAFLSVKNYKWSRELQGVHLEIRSYGVHRLLLCQELKPNSPMYDILNAEAYQMYGEDYQVFGLKNKNNCVSAISKVLHTIYSDIDPHTIIPNSLDNKLKNADFKKSGLDKNDAIISSKKSFDPDFEDNKIQCLQYIGVTLEELKSVIPHKEQIKILNSINDTKSNQGLCAALTNIEKYCDKKMESKKHNIALFKKNKTDNSGAYQVLKDTAILSISKLTSSQLKENNNDEQTITPTI